MSVPAPSVRHDDEEWSDFEIPDGHTMGKEDDDDEDWDLDPSSKPLTIRPPVQLADLSDVDDDDDEGVSTIKVTSLPPIPLRPAFQSTADDDDDFEDAFALPSDLTQLSLAPLSLTHRASKSSLEWAGDKDHTSSSQSSDAYSTLGFADHPSSSSNSTSSVSLPETENEEEEEEDLDGLVLPDDIFESGQGSRHLRKILHLKKTAVVPATRALVTSPEEDDFEMGLVIEDDVDLSPSRLLHNKHKAPANRSNSAPPQRVSSGLRPPSRLTGERAKSPSVNPPALLSRKLRMSPAPHPPPPARSQSFQPIPSGPSASSSFLTPKPTSLRGQKSHSGLKPSPMPAARLTRKASLSSLMETSSQASGSGASSSASGTSKVARYEEPTASSRARTLKTLGRVQSRDYNVPPTRPSTPSANSAALRLTLPTQCRLRTRPTLSTVWAQSPSVAPSPSPTFRTSSPLSPRPPSNLSRPIKTQVSPPAAAPKMLKRPKRQKILYDGTELDGIEDLPTDRDKESRFRVQPKNTRVPGGSYPSKSQEGKGTLRKKSRRDISTTVADALKLFPPSSSLKRPPPAESTPPKKKKVGLSSDVTRTHRKPTLIRNLGGANTTKVVGDMKWNPYTLRWEGNEAVLKDFDPVVTSTRPALITHLTGSSIGSPVTSFAAGARIVGTMMFDPENLRWISTLPPEEDEPDVFANLADDEDDADSWEARGGTIRPSQQTATNQLPPSVDPSLSTSSTNSSGLVAHSPARSHISSGSDRGSRASMVHDVDDDFIEQCRLAGERHQLEMKGWMVPQDIFVEANRAYLYEIRAVATRDYAQ